MTDVQDRKLSPAFSSQPSQDQLLSKIRSEIDRLIRQRPLDTPTPAAARITIPPGSPQPPNLIPLTPHHLLRVPSEPELPPLEFRPSIPLDDLLRYDDEAFVNEMYLALLRRLPDAEGLDYYLRVMRNGIQDKIDALVELKQSDEARRINTVIVGLDEKLRRRRWRKIPLLGRLLSIAAAVADLPRLSKTVQHEAAHAARHRRETARTFNALAENIEGVMARQSGEIFGQLRSQVRFIHRHKAAIRPVSQLAEDLAQLQQFMDTTYSQLADQCRSLTQDLDPPALHRRLAELAATTQSLHTQIRQVEHLTKSPLAALIESLAEIPAPPPLFGLQGLHPVARDPTNLKAQAIAHALQPFGRRYHLIHFACAAGFHTFHLAQRGAVAVGFDENPAHIQLANALRAVNGIPAEFAVKSLDLDTVRQIPHGAYDVALILSALDPLIASHGPAVARQLLTELADRIPVLILELPPENSLTPPLDLTAFSPALRIQKIGDFPSENSPLHENLETRNQEPISGNRKPQTENSSLYLLTHEAVTVNNTTYPIRSRSFVAYPQAPAMARQFIWSDHVFIKKYLAAGDSPRGRSPSTQWHFNVPQILREIVNYQLLPASTTALPRLIDCELHADTIALVFERINGTNLMDLLTAGTPVPPHTLLKPLLTALRQLRQVGLYHNDLRPWNVLVNQNTGNTTPGASGISGDISSGASAVASSDISSGAPNSASPNNTTSNPAAPDTVWLIDLGLATPAENESTIAGLLWILHDAARGRPSDHYPMPLTSPPSTNPLDYPESIRPTVQQLLDSPNINAFFDRIDINI